MVAEQGNFRKSAQLLNTAQPALTRTIQALEHDLGVSLFRRTTRSVTLTAAGRELYGHATSVFEQVEQVATSVRDVASGRGGTVSLAYIDFAILGKLPHILETYRAVNPRVKLNVRFASSSDQVTLVQEGKTDVGFLLDVDAKLPNGFCRRQISIEPLVAVVPAKHPLADRTSIELGELSDEAFITGDSWHRFNQLIEELCLARNFSPRITQKAFLRDEMLAFVMAGLGILVYPACIRNAGLLGVKLVPIDDVPPVIRTSAIWSAFSNNPVLPSFIKQITPG
jgi:DNA-binding transcriptional LysR family regulator